MSLETSAWLNGGNILVGMGQKPWWYDESLINSLPESPLYDGPIPLEDIERRLFHFKAVAFPVASLRPVVPGDDATDRMTVTIDKVLYRVVLDPERILVGPNDHDDTFGVFSTGYDVDNHQFSDVLLGMTSQILDDDLGVESAGLLQNRAVGWVSVALPDTITTKTGIDFRPRLLAATSFNGTMATGWDRVYTLSVCHAPGTPIIDDDWRGDVENHPSASGLIWADGKEIRIKGLPFAERVSNDHRYWVRERSCRPTPKRRRDLKALGLSVGRRVGIDSTPEWVHASALTPLIHEIGCPIDMTEVPVDPALADLEVAWFLGYAWGDGHLGREGHFGGTVTVSVAENAITTLDRLMRLAKEYGSTGKPIQRPGCWNVSIYDGLLYDTCKAFYTGEGYSRKVPPAWVEQAPLDWQRALIQGYYAADGNQDTTEGCIVASVSLDGLLALRRMLMRLGIPSSIRKGRSPALASTIQGRTVTAKPIFTLRFANNVEQLGYETRFKSHFQSHPYIEDGVLWSRVDSVTDWHGEVCPITTATHEYLTAFGRSHNCDNTLSQARGESIASGSRVRVRHTKNSQVRLGDARAALGIVFQMADEWSKALDALVNAKVTEKQFEQVLDIMVPLPKDEGRGLTLAETKRQQLTLLYHDDERVTPWVGTQFGVLQAFNTHRQHQVVVKGQTHRAERNMINVLNGTEADADMEVLRALEMVTA